ncbi:MAG: glutamine amidotransferase [Planctomycetota bacterium]|nr:glutamine amidotransferase [Planctomycetota bacterium]
MSVPIDFDQPMWLLAGIPLLASLVFISTGSRAGLPNAVKKTALVLRGMAITALVLALARMVHLTGGDGLSILVLRDLSASVPRLVTDEAISKTSRRLGTLEYPDQVSLISFAKDQQQEQPMAMRLGSGTSVKIDRSGSDIAAALRYSASALEGSAPGGSRRIVLISDGNSTEGDPVREAKNLAAAGIAVDVMPVRYDHPREVIMESVEAPETVRPGQVFSVDSIIWSSSAGSATVVLADGEGIIERRPMTLEAGRNRIAFTLDGGTSILQRLNVSVHPEPGLDSLEQNNFGIGLVRTIHPPRVVLVSEDPDRTLERLLTSGNINVQRLTPDQIPLKPEEYFGIEALILDDISAFSIDPQRIAMLEKVVHTTGMGLLMVGGPNSFGAGGWRGTEVEKALPVKMDIQQRKNLPNGALAVILHTCEFELGNMWARRIAFASIEPLTPKDEFGVLVYSGGVDYWGIPLGPLGDRGEIQKKINTLQPADMTTFGASMQMALLGLLRSNSYSKHVVIISDGDPVKPGMRLLDAYAQAGISVSTICIQPHSGASATATMKKIASSTGGRFYFVDHPASLPQIFFREALEVKRNLITEETFTPTIVEIADPIRGLESGFPPLHGIVLTTIKPLSNLVLVNQEEDPLLALGRHGIGKTAAFMSDARARWSEQWQGWSGNSTFWTQLVRSISRELEEGVLEISHSIEGDSAQLIVDAIDPDGRFLDGMELECTLISPDQSERKIVVNQVAPGRYIGKFDAAQEGSYLIHVNHDDGQGHIGGQTKSISVGYPAEFRVLQSNEELLKRIAEASGGRILTDADDLLDRSLPQRKDRSPLWHPLAIVGLFLFFFDIVTRRVQLKIPVLKRSSKPIAKEATDTPPLVRRAIAARRKPAAQPSSVEPKVDSERQGETPEIADHRSADFQKLIEARRKKRKRDR